MMITPARTPLLTRQRAIWLAVLLAALLAAFAPAPRVSAAPTTRVFRIEARTFEYSPAVLRVNPGDTVTVEVVSTDVVHGFYLDSYGLSMSADPGQTASLTFMANQPGSFRFRCPVACGQLHPFMVGKLQVGPNWLLIRGAALGIILVLVSLWKLH